MSAIEFVKGHGTGNDFLVIVDEANTTDFTPTQIVALCDRHRGVGADGVLRAVASTHAPAGLDTAGTRWFMDYRNADGSAPEMCGNGIRLFVHVLRMRGQIETAAVDIATRGGVHRVTVSDDGEYCVNLGKPTTPLLRAAPVVTVAGRGWPAVGVMAPNPHAVVFVDDLDDAGDLLATPTVTPPDMFPDGCNVEFVAVRGDAHIAMRVHERGVGETLSCGTGAVAAAWAFRRRSSVAAGPTRVRVDVPGGTLHVDEHDDGTLSLTGPVQVVATGSIDPIWWENQ